MQVYNPKVEKSNINSTKGALEITSLMNQSRIPLMKAIQSKRRQHLPGSLSLSKGNQSSATASNMDSLTQTVVKQKNCAIEAPGFRFFI